MRRIILTGYIKFPVKMLVQSMFFSFIPINLLHTFPWKYFALVHGYFGLEWKWRMIVRLTKLKTYYENTLCSIQIIATQLLS